VYAVSEGLIWRKIKVV